MNMKRFRHLLAAALRVASTAAVGLLTGPPSVRSKGFGPVLRARTCDVAFGFRMGAGFPGDVNRMHPASIVPGLINLTTPPRNYGDPVVINGADGSYRGVVTGDNSATALAIDGVTVRPYPTQQSSGGMASAFGATPAPVSGVMDALRSGFIMCKLPAGVAVLRGGIPFIWCAATSGVNVQGALVGAASAGNTVPIANAQFNGAADPSGNVELEVWQA